jgi:hypothetical protein
MPLKRSIRRGLKYSYIPINLTGSPSGIAIRSQPFYISKEQLCRSGQGVGNWEEEEEEDEEEEEED